MSRRVSFCGGLCGRGAGALVLVSLVLAGCLLADVGIDPELEPETTINPAQGGAGGVANGSGGGSGALAREAGSGGGSAGNPNVTPPAQGGSAGMGSGNAGEAGGASIPPNMAGMAGAGNLSMSTCLTGLDREQACAAYCGTYEEACRGRSLLRISTGEMETPYTYDNAEQCAQTCRDSDWVIGNIGVLGSIMCRCHHATLAIDEGPNPHCFHAAEVPSEGGCAAPPL